MWQCGTFPKPSVRVRHYPSFGLGAEVSLQCNRLQDNLKINH